jgi:hypothetical protein
VRPLLSAFGALLTVDRPEIEALQSIQKLIAEYCDSRLGKPSKPLSIGVFGPPGSGKSFGVREIARITSREKIKEITFNLSQFSDPAELWGAFHRVRDVSLSGEIPLVFWDEFDNSLGRERLGWLRYFLAPMQDGECQQGEITHPIGRSIFVFAGGTADRMEELGRPLSEDRQKQAKVRDFLSRLKGFLDVLGPNPQGVDPQKTDPHFMLRRAILLRAMVKKKANHFFDRDVLRIDSGVLHAFLTVTKFKHGARSMEAIIAASALAGRNSFERSCLPSAEQLELHVDGEEFLGLAREVAR